jgi:hypothetical protein
METIIVWLLSVQVWTEPDPKIKFVYTKEYPTHEECMREKQQWEEKKLVALCLTKNKNVNTVAR